ncbi:HNH endonuclease signature motif containing protein [Gryllotalpicola protaetiae]|uniref:HNH endonuclease n=1 Tax=Gryllotalpicola protaetiae TaxID=2419771 RepID=A0A387BPU7_9MICO|nr:HNH endonuclease signature motif containing protein [Gryllotalpicola protaetiae]AYG03037.1 HNH endonuclease [Gryllotalpicola protaetiae]
MSKVGAAACETLTRLGRALPVDPAVLTDGQLIRLVEDAEAAQRQVGAVKLAVAAEMARRSAADDPGSLARRLGFKTAAAALSGLTGSSGREAQRLVTEAADLAGLPAVEAAVLDGRIGREAAAAISGELKKAASTADAGDLEAAQTELVELAVSTGADEVRAKAAETAAGLTVEVVQEQAKKAMAERFFWMSPVIDGSARVSGRLPTGHASVIKSVLDGLRNPKGKKTVTFQPVAEDAPGDARTAGQADADHLRDVFALAARSVDMPDMAGDHPTVWLSTTLSELESGAGLAFYAGTPGPVPASEAVQAACTGGTQAVIFDDQGAVLNLGRSTRGFTRRQRRAISLRDGGTCLIPDCSVPAQWCEVHHVISYRDGGATDIGNGVNLCWFHHHDIDTGPWQIRMTNGTPEVRYAYGGRTIDWKPVGNGTAAHLQTTAPPGAPPPLQ